MGTVALGRAEQQGSRLQSPPGCPAPWCQVCPVPASTEVTSHPFPGAGESGKSTIVKQMK